MKTILGKISQNIPFLLTMGILSMFVFVSILSVGQGDPYNSQHLDGTLREIAPNLRKVAAENPSQVTTAEDKPNAMPLVVTPYPEGVRLVLRMFSKINGAQTYSNIIEGFKLISFSRVDEFPRILRALPVGKAYIFKAVVNEHRTTIGDLITDIPLSFPQILETCPDVAPLIEDYAGAIQTLRNIDSQYRQQNNLLQGVIDNPESTTNQAILDNVVRVMRALYNITIGSAVKGRYMNILNTCYGPQ